MMNKKTFIKTIGKKTGLPDTHIRIALNAITGEITRLLSTGDYLTLYGFGSFISKMKPERTGFHFGKKEIIQLPERVLPVFRPAKELTTSVNKGRKPSAFERQRVYEKKNRS